MSSVLNAAHDVESFSNYLILTHRAVAQNDLAWKDSPPSVSVTALDGSSQDFYGYNYASRIYKDAVLPGFVRLWQNETTHPLVLGVEDVDCPFALARSTKRLDDELLFWGKVAGAQDIRDRHTLIRTRLSALHKACPAGKLEISWTLANSYGRDLIRLTDWKRETVGMSMFGTDIVEYTVPAAPGETFDTLEMQAKKFELDAQASIIVPLLSQNLSNYKAAYKAVDTSTMSNRDRRAHSDSGFSRNISVKRWEAAMTELDATQ